MRTRSKNNRGVWQNKSPLKVARSHPATAVYRDKIYVFGGGGPAFKSLNTVEAYDPYRNRWFSLGEMPSYRSGAVALTVEDRIYIIGGGFKKPDGKFRFLPTVEVYNPQNDTWEKGMDMLKPHDYPATALVNGTIYIIGGHHPDATEGGPQTDPGFSFCERFNPQKDLWEEVVPLPTPRFAASAIAYQGRIFTMGGVAFTSEGFKEFDCIETYDPVLRVWSRSADMVLPCSMAAHGSCLVQNRLYVCGGFTGETGIGVQCAVYDFGSNRWSVAPPLPQPRAAMGVALIDRTIYLIGGWAADRSVMNGVIAYQP